MREAESCLFARGITSKRLRAAALFVMPAWQAGEATVAEMNRLAKPKSLGSLRFTHDDKHRQSDCGSLHHFTGD